MRLRSIIAMLALATLGATGCSNLARDNRPSLAEPAPSKAWRYDGETEAQASEKAERKKYIEALRSTSLFSI